MDAMESIRRRCSLLQSGKFGGRIKALISITRRACKVLSGRIGQNNNALEAEIIRLRRENDELQKRNETLVKIPMARKPADVNLWPAEKKIGQRILLMWMITLMSTRTLLLKIY